MAWKIDDAGDLQVKGAPLNAAEIAIAREFLKQGRALQAKGAVIRSITLAPEHFDGCQLLFGAPIVRSPEVLWDGRKVAYLVTYSIP